MLKKTVRLIIGVFFVVISATAYAVCEERSDLYVTAWSFKAMMATHNMNADNAEKMLSDAAHYYTPEAWVEYENYAKSQGVTERVIRNQLVVSTGIENSPVIETKMAEEWVVQLPLLINYSSTGSYHQENQKVTLHIAHDSRCHLKITHINIV